MEASWPNWWGSPELFANVVREIERSLTLEGSGCTTSIRLQSARGEQTFSSRSDFLQAPAEFVASLRRLTATCTRDSVKVTFELFHRPRTLLNRDQALLSIEGVDEQRELQLLQLLAPSVRPGYAPYWGRAEIPAGIDPGGRFPHLYRVRSLVDFVLGAVLGAGLFLAAGEYGLAPVAPVLCLIVGFFLPAAINAFVPNVQIAPEGQTRGKKIVARILASIGAIVLAWAGHLFTGS